jgi:hypothetical protein
MSRPGRGASAGRNDRATTSSAAAEAVTVDLTPFGVAPTTRRRRPTPRKVTIAVAVQLVLHAASSVCEFISLVFLVYMGSFYSQVFPATIAAAACGLFLDCVAMATLLGSNPAARRLMRSTYPEAVPLIIIFVELCALGLFAVGFTTLIVSYYYAPVELETYPVPPDYFTYRYANPIEIPWRFGTVVLQGIGLGFHVVFMVMECVTCCYGSRR